MSILHAIVFILAALYFYSSSKHDEQKWQFIFACCMLLFCSFFRSMAEGYDTERYVDYFLRFRRLSLSDSMVFEPGYIILNKVIGLFTDNGQVFLSVLSILTLVPIFILIWKCSDNPLLSLLVFVAVGNLFSSYAALRQWCAVAVFVIAYWFIIERRLILFLCTVLLAYSFHQTALFVLPLYFLYPIRITRSKLFLCVALSIIMLLFSEQIMDFLNMFARLETERNSNGGYIQMLTYWALIIIIDVFAYPIENEKHMKLNYMALLYSAVIQPMCFAYSAFARIHLYTWFGMALGIPRLIQYMDRNYDRQNSFLLKLGVAAIMIAWYLITQDDKFLTLII